jgi:hypothetical protein
MTVDWCAARAGRVVSQGWRAQVRAPRRVNDVHQWHVWLGRRRVRDQRTLHSDRTAAGESAARPEDAYGAADAPTRCGRPDKRGRRPDTSHSRMIATEPCARPCPPRRRSTTVQHHSTRRAAPGLIAAPNECCRHVRQALQSGAHSRQVGAAQSGAGSCRASAGVLRACTLERGCAAHTVPASCPLLARGVPTPGKSAASALSPHVRPLQPWHGVAMPQQPQGRAASGLPLSELATARQLA